VSPVEEGRLRRRLVGLLANCASEPTGPGGSPRIRHPARLRLADRDARKVRRIFGLEIYLFVVAIIIPSAEALLTVSAVLTSLISLSSRT
jgi:hypothetical protein